VLNFQTYHCTECDDFIDPRRVNLGYMTCLGCGERAAREVKHCIVPLHKSSYTVLPAASARALLPGINNKGGFFR